MGEMTATRTVSIECPLMAGAPGQVVRERSGNAEVSIRFEDTDVVPGMLPRFLGDRCQFVPSARAMAEAGVGDLEYWTTRCPLHPDNPETNACFLRPEKPEA